MQAVAINLAIVGLSVRNAHELRQRILKASPDGVTYNWISVTDPSLNLLLINEDFAETPSIQRIVQTRHVPVLQVCRQHDSGGQDSLRLWAPIEESWAEPVRDDSDALLQLWLRRYLGGSIEPVVTHAPVAEAMPVSMPDVQVQDVSVILHEPVPVEPIDRLSVQPEPVPASAPQPLMAASLTSVPQWDLDFFQPFLQPESTPRKLINQQGMVGLVDTQGHLFWPGLGPVDVSRLHEGLMLTYATAADRVRVEGCPQDLHQWLWQLVWGGSAQLAVRVPDQPIKLLGWPQPALRSVWREVMSLCAALHRRPMRPSQLARLLEMPQAQVDRLVFSLLASGLARPLGEAEQAQQPPVETLENSVTQSSGGVRSFFSRLRNKLGL